MPCLGRCVSVRKTLYLATVTITRLNPTIRCFHTSLFRQGKSRKVAMYKMFSALNSVLRDRVNGNQILQPATMPNEAAEQQLAG